MQCPACGNQNKANSRFCAYCGYALQIDEPETLQAGQLMDGGVYRIIRPLGKGGMGAVYLAANTKAFDRQCVVKEVIEYYDPSNPQEREKAAQRFEIEARILATLKHQGIPDIYAYFSENGRNYLVMEYIEGPDLAETLTREDGDQLVKGRSLKANDVIRYTIQICEVLDYLERHQPPVIHNDIKPANIIRDRNTGRAVLVDFGTAKTRYSAQAAGLPGRKQSSVYGTMGFAAPELYDGQAEPRSDVYALAVTAYNLITDDDPRLHPFQFPKMELVPTALREVLLQALAVKVEDRLTAAQFGERLEALLRPQVQPLSPLTFPGGDKAVSREEMLDLCVKHWHYAADILYDGSVTRWLRDAIHDPAAARTAEMAVQHYANDPNSGLEYLVRSLAPQAMPEPQLRVITGRLRYERAVERDSSRQIEVQNTGGGYLYGTVKSSAAWVEVLGKLACAPGQTQTLPVVIHADQLVPGGVHQARISIQASGAQAAVIPVEVKVPPPIIDVSPTHIDLSLIARDGLFTERGAFEVRNRGKVRAECRVEGNPAWLVLDPARFTVSPGEIGRVGLVGRIDKLPAEPRARISTLDIRVHGLRPRQVQVVVRTGPEKQSIFESPWAIGCAAILMMAALLWFGLIVLPLLWP